MLNLKKNKITKNKKTMKQSKGYDHPHPQCCHLDSESLATQTGNTANCTSSFSLRGDISRRITHYHTVSEAVHPHIN